MRENTDQKSSEYEQFLRTPSYTTDRPNIHFELDLQRLINRKAFSSLGYAPMLTTNFSVFLCFFRFFKAFLSYFINITKKNWVIMAENVIFTSRIAQKFKFSIKDFFSNCIQIRSFLRFGHIW